MASRGKHGKRFTRGASAPAAAAAIAALILLASFSQSHAAPPIQGFHPAGGPSLPRESAPRPASMGRAAAPGVAALQGAPLPNFDEQLGTTFTQDFSSLEYNVTAVAQADADGYGPGYLLNGLTPNGYWYQVGLSYHWPNSDGSYFPGFGFSYQVYGSNGNSVYPSKGAGLDAFSGVVSSGDSVLLSLTFAGSSVVMRAQDWNSGAAAQTIFSNEGASSFAGSPFSSIDAHGFFTGLMTEWYHTAVYTGNEGQVAYTNMAVALSSAWMWADEFDSSSRATIFNNQTQSPVTIVDDQVYPYATGGVTMYISAHRFVTGLAGVASRLTLRPATLEASSPALSATYTLTGQPQTAVIAPGANVLDADQGSMITVAIAPTSAPEFWVFNGTSGNEVTFAAGTNATYVYYHLVEETVSYQVAGGGNLIPPSLAPELTYEVPPAAASAAVSFATRTQAIGTTPIIVLAVAGSSASVNATVFGGADHRWEASAQNWTVSAPDSLPEPIEFYEQYRVSVSYDVSPETLQAGSPPLVSGKPGALPPQPPEVTSTFLGNQTTEPLTSNQTFLWFDAGSHYSWTPVINGSAPDERWIALGNATSLGTISASVAASAAIVLTYVHQYHASLGVNELEGGYVSYLVAAPFEAGDSAGVGSAWIPAGSNLTATASSNAGWQFQEWDGSGAGAYAGTKTSISLTVTGPLSENATFYPGLEVAADAGTDIVFSYGSVAGTVGAGTTKTLYVPPSSNVTLRATPSLFAYSFASWRGPGLAGDTKATLSLVVDSPSTVTGTHSYNYQVVGGAALVTAIVVVLALSLLVRNRRREQVQDAIPSYA